MSGHHSRLPAPELPSSMLDNGLTPLATMGISFLTQIWSPAAAYTALASVTLGLALLHPAFFKRIRQLE